jgi:hypothetical protein
LPISFFTEDLLPTMAFFTVQTIIIGSIIPNVAILLFTILFINNGKTAAIGMFISDVAIDQQQKSVF